jgi:hypothetical protein
VQCGKFNRRMAGSGHQRATVAQVNHSPCGYAPFATGSPLHSNKS